MKLSSKQVSVDAPFSFGEENSLLDVIQNDQQPSPDNELISESLKAEVKSVLAMLPEREAEVIRLYFGLDGEYPMTLEEIGEKFNLTRERVRQIKEKAIRRLRHNSKSNILKSYLG
jgi:RNA polymerase primary sigma factor